MRALGFLGFVLDTKGVWKREWNVQEDQAQTHSSEDLQIFASREEEQQKYMQIGEYPHFWGNRLQISALESRQDRNDHKWSVGKQKKKTFTRPTGVLDRGRLGGRWKAFGALWESLGYLGALGAPEGSNLQKNIHKP